MPIKWLGFTNHVDIFMLIFNRTRVFMFFLHNYYKILLLNAWTVVTFIFSDYGIIIFMLTSLGKFHDKDRHLTEHHRIFIGQNEHLGQPKARVFKCYITCVTFVISKSLSTIWCRRHYNLELYIEQHHLDERDVFITTSVTLQHDSLGEYYLCNF